MLLGRVEYADGLELQRQLAAARAQQLVGDTLLLLEHPPILTLGRAAKAENIIVPRQALAEAGIEVFETNRGGDVTYHGPGQWVGYLIFDLNPDRRDVRRFVRNIEEGLIRTVARFGIQADRIPEWTGVWVGEKGKDAGKIAAIGVHISRWVTSHGFALNVAPNLAHFGLIVPCGIRDADVTSMARVLGKPIAMSDVITPLADAFAEAFDSTVRISRPQAQTVSVVVTREGPHGREVLLLKRTEARGGFWQPVTGTVREGERPEQAAARELAEEVGHPLEVRALDYRHAFALGQSAPPRIVEESAFHATWSGEPVRLAPHEHDEHAWLPVEEALRRVPFVGLQRAIALSRLR